MPAESHDENKSVSENPRLPVGRKVREGIYRGVITMPANMVELQQCFLPVFDSHVARQPAFRRYETCAKYENITTYSGIK